VPYPISEEKGSYVAAIKIVMGVFGPYPSSICYSDKYIIRIQIAGRGVRETRRAVDG
jgi:hypothetical protein